MRAKLTIIAGPDRGRDVSVDADDSVVIGRSDEADFQIADPSVSRRHCRLTCEEASWRLEDLGSASGTWVNSLACGEKPLQHGDEIRIGDTDLRFELSGTEPPTLPPSRDVASPPTPPQLGFLVGRTVVRYEIEEQINSGRTGVVFRARDTKTDETVAFKAMLPNVVGAKEEVDRFVRGMQVMFPLRHPNIIRIHNAGFTEFEDQNGLNVCWVAMDYVDGFSLRSVIDRTGAANMLDWTQAFQVAKDIASALELAFENKILHRDITPDNILIESESRRARLGDLMLAKALEGAGSQQITRRGEVVGDLAYMSPERVRDDAVDCRSDLYSLGATLYAVVTGRPPYAAETLPDMILAIQTHEITPPREFQLSVNDHFAATIMRLLSKEPRDRFENPTRLLKELEQIGTYAGLKS